MFRIKTSDIHSGFKHQSGQLRNKVQWFEHDVRCPNSIRCLQLVSDHTLGGDRGPFLRYRRAGDIAAQAFQFLAFTRFFGHTNMQGKVGDFTDMVRAKVAFFQWTVRPGAAKHMNVRERPKMGSFAR